MLAHERTGVALTAFATELAVQFGCARVLVGFMRGSGIELAAVSHGGGDALTGEAFDGVTAAMDEAVAQACCIYLPSQPGDRTYIRMEHQRWQQRQGGSVLSVPMVRAGEMVGAIGCEWSDQQADMAQMVTRIEDVLAFCGPSCTCCTSVSCPGRSAPGALCRAAGRACATTTTDAYSLAWAQPSWRWQGFAPCRWNTT